MFRAQQAASKKKKPKPFAKLKELQFSLPAKRIALSTRFSLFSQHIVLGSPGEEELVCKALPPGRALYGV